MGILKAKEDEKRREQYARDKELAREKYEKLQLEKKNAAAKKIQDLWRSVQGKKGLSATLAKIRYQKAEEIATAKERKRQEEERRKAEEKAKEEERKRAQHEADRD